MAVATDMLPMKRGMSVVAKNVGAKELCLTANVVMVTQQNVLLIINHVTQRSTERIT